MRRTLKFLHTVGSIGFCGALAALMVLHVSLPDPTEIERFATLRLAMGSVARWILLPSMGLVVVSGLLSMAATPAFHNAGWVYAKLASGILVFEGTLVYVQGPMERAALEARAVLEGGVSDVATMASPLGAEWGSFWVLLAVGIGNVAVAIWRPRFSRKKGRGGGGVGTLPTG
jgi:uncharacterized membrane protein